MATPQQTTKERSPHWLVITDLDGTLLDHDTYSYQAAVPALQRLKSLNIPVVINTSKTWREVSDFAQELERNELALSAPYIVENGSAVVASSDSLIKPVKVLGTPRAKILRVLSALREDFGFRFSGFSDWSVDELVSQTGLIKDQAVNAMARDYSEPIVWLDSQENYQFFVTELETRGLITLEGGRFVHVQGRCDKGAAMLWLQQHLAKGDGECPRLVVLGDSQNDVAMLSLADVAVVVRSPVHAPLQLPQASGAVIYAEREGPEGWNETINMLLDGESA